jgi:hypothetical protein
MNIEDYVHQHILLIYLIGAVVVGLPMALITVTCYLLEEKLDEEWYFWPLKMLRNAVHPGSFLFLPDCEHEPRANYRSHYEGPVSEILDNYDEIGPPQILMYFVLSIAGWPIRLLITVCGLGLLIVGLVISTPFWLIWLMCKAICWPFRKKK